MRRKRKGRGLSTTSTSANRTPRRGPGPVRAEPLGKGTNTNKPRTSKPKKFSAKVGDAIVDDMTRRSKDASYARRKKADLKYNPELANERIKKAGQRQIGRTVRFTQATGERQATERRKEREETERKQAEAVLQAALIGGQADDLPNTDSVQAEIGSGDTTTNSSQGNQSYWDGVYGR